MEMGNQVGQNQIQGNMRGGQLRWGTTINQQGRITEGADEDNDWGDDEDNDWGDMFIFECNGEEIIIDLTENNDFIAIKTYW